MTIDEGGDSQSVKTLLIANEGRNLSRPVVSIPHNNIFDTRRKYKTLLTRISIFVQPFNIRLSMYWKFMFSLIMQSQ